MHSADWVTRRKGEAMLGMCLNKRVLGGLVIVGVGVFVFAPNLLATALPLLLVAICPLSMLFMAKGMMGGGQRAALGQSNATLSVATSYACPMHRDMISTSPGRCTTCGMALAPVVAAPPIDVPYRSSPALEPGEQIALLRLQLQRVGEQQAVLSQQLARLQAPEILPFSKTDKHDADQVSQTVSAAGT